MRRQLAPADRKRRSGIPSTRADIPRIFLKTGKRAGSNSRGLESFMTRSPDSVVSASTGRKAENRKSCHEQNSCDCRNRDRRRAAGDGSGHEHRRRRRRTSDASRKHRRPHRRGIAPALIRRATVRGVSWHFSTPSPRRPRDASGIGSSLPRGSLRMTGWMQFACGERSQGPIRHELEC